MKKQIHLDVQTLESMESCRPGIDDLADPAMAHVAAKIEINADLEKLFNRVQNLDVQIGAAFNDVPVPPGLAQRVLDRVSQQGVEKLASAAFSEVPLIPNANRQFTSPPANYMRKVSLRRMLLFGGLLSAAVVSFIALWLNSYNAERYSEQTALDEAIRFFDAGAADDGFLLAENSPPIKYPFSRAIFRDDGVRWRDIRGFLGRAGIAYILPCRNGARATLFVIEQSIDGLSRKPPLHPFTTGGYSASVWQEGGLLYVLVVQGDPQTYQNYLNLPRSPVA